MTKRKKKVKAARPTVLLTVPISPELKHVLGVEADNAGQPMNEFVADAVAAKCGRPELAMIPRRGYGGRPRKEIELSDQETATD